MLSPDCAKAGITKYMGISEKELIKIQQWPCIKCRYIHTHTHHTHHQPSIHTKYITF